MVDAFSVATALFVCSFEPFIMEYGLWVFTQLSIFLQNYLAAYTLVKSFNNPWKIISFDV